MTPPAKVRATGTGTPTPVSTVVTPAERQRCDPVEQQQQHQADDEGHHAQHRVARQVTGDDPVQAVGQPIDPTGHEIAGAV
ncbi:MAG: hypothetical protein LC799_12285 [Actinobacteria bacterium]|nr:hypothetical protein [Actinomycetota bacterium]